MMEFLDYYSAKDRFNALFAEIAQVLADCISL